MTSLTAPRRPILLGRIVSAHGIRGEVVIATYTGEPGAIADYGPLFEAGGARAFEIVSARVGLKGVVARLKGVNDRTAAEALRGLSLTVPRERLPALPDGEFYHEDLAGLAAVDPAGVGLGTVVAVQNFGAGDLLELRLAGTQRTELVPFTVACVPHVDVAGGWVVVQLPELVQGEPRPGEEPPGAV